MAKRWKMLGGIPDKLYNTIQDGQKKPAILGGIIGVDPATDTAALLATAAPIIAALLAFLDKDGKAKEVLAATKTFLQTKYPNVDWSGYDFLDQPGGTPIRWEGDPAYDENLGANNPGNLSNDPLYFFKSNPLITAGIGGAATYIATKRQPQQKRFLYSALVAGSVYLLLRATTGSGSKRQALISAFNAMPATIMTAADKQRLSAAFTEMTSSEIDSVYTWYFDYVRKGILVPQGSDLYNSIMALDAKYQIVGT
jgi:hypothetical protein